MENQDGKPEGVMVGRSRQGGQADPLQLRRGVGRNSDRAEEEPPGSFYLEAITVDQEDGRLLGNKKIALVDITDHMPMLVQDGECTGRIRRRTNEKRPARVGETGSATFGIV